MILAANRWNTNGELIADCHKLNYLRNHDLILDPTFGGGKWWTHWRPQRMIFSDIKIDGTDFRNLPHRDEAFTAVAFDPPYCAKGGRETSGIRDMDDRYGQYDCPPTPELLQELINQGLNEMYRVVKPSANKGLHATKPNGIVLVKCMDYISSGKFFPGTHYTLSHAMRLGFIQEDRMEHIGDPGPQPGGRRQVHARRNLSTLLVLRKV